MSTSVWFYLTSLALVGAIGAPIEWRVSLAEVDRAALERLLLGRPDAPSMLAVEMDQVPAIAVGLLAERVRVIYQEEALNPRLIAHREGSCTRPVSSPEWSCTIAEAPNIVRVLKAPGHAGTSRTLIRRLQWDRRPEFSATELVAAIDFLESAEFAGQLEARSPEPGVGAASDCWSVYTVPESVAMTVSGGGREFELLTGIAAERGCSLQLRQVCDGQAACSYVITGNSMWIE